MINKVSKNVNRQKRHLRLRQTLSGTATKPRLNVFRSNKQIYAQIIDDTKGITLCSASSRDTEAGVKNGSNVEAASISFFVLDFFYGFPYCLYGVTE